MCGIAGLTLAPSGPVKAEWMESLLKHLEHRGPDDAGWLSFRKGKISLGKAIAGDCDADLVFVHRRLSILDLSESGWQPMGTPDRRYWVVFNGEIYNYLELRSELEALGHRFRSRSDTEVLLAAFAEWGPQCLNRLLGMFAFAVLDVKTRTLFLARDFFGIKPLYYTCWQEGFAFASEIRALLELPGVNRLVNPQRLFDYLRSGITDHGSETFFAQVKQLPAAHHMEVSLDHPGSPEPVRYWQVDLNRKADLSFDKAAEQLRDLFLESVRFHLRSDVPVGAALSGGIDSSSIVAAMRLLDPDLVIHTFSYIADDPALSEERWVDVVGRAARVVVHKVRATSEELVDDLDRLIGVQGEPFGSTSMYAQNRIFRSARETGIKVMLDGQGADELLAGYPTYIGARIGSLARQGHWAEAIRLWRAASQLPGATSLRTLSPVLGFLVPPKFKDPLRRLLGNDRPPAWLNESWFSERGANERSLRCLNGNDHQKDELLKHELYLTLTQTSLPQLLHYEDRNSMTYSIESRVPFLTPPLVDFLFALPEAYVIAADGTTKSVFRQAMRGIVPDAILDRKDKMGFPTPERNWLISARSWVKGVLASEAAGEIPAIDMKRTLQEWAQIEQGNVQFDSRVWRWLNLILWVQKFAVRVE